MDIDAFLATLFPHIPVNEVGETILRYFSPLSLSSFGIHFRSLRESLPTLTCYFAISSITLCGEKKEIAPTASILERIFDTICRTQHMNYPMGKHMWTLHGEMFVLDADIDDPSSILAYDDRLDYGRECIDCHKFAMTTSNRCFDCFDLDEGGDIDEGFKSRCEKERAETEDQEVDKEFSGLICTFEDEEYDFTLSCVWSGFRVDEEDESKDYENETERNEYIEYRNDRGVMQLSAWEKGVRSQPYTYQRTIYPC